jgi:hypothetical protein
MDDFAAATGSPSDQAVLPWDLDLLAPDDLRRLYEGVASFVAWLEECNIEVPRCWYTHGWVVRRLAALSYWHEVAYAPGSPPRDAADWWLVGVEPLRRDWQELLAHRGKHVDPEAPFDHPQPVPSLEDTIEHLLAERQR